MQNRFTDLLQQLAPVGEEELLRIAQVAQPKQFKKREFLRILLQESFVPSTPDGVCRHIGFLQTGIFRVYHLNEDKEVTDYFNTEDRNPFVSSFKSFLTQAAQAVYVEAITDATIVTISYTDLQQLYVEFKSLERIGRLLAEKNYLLALERIEALQYHSAGQRYEAFLKQYPLLINQIPHHYIASYLGVTPESLSRIRKSLI